MSGADILNLIKVKIKDLKFADYNPRKKLKKTDAEYLKIKASIENFGYVDPVIINKDNTIIGGHQRTTVLEDLGRKVIDAIQIDVPKEKEKALNIALNKISGEWDFTKLTGLLKEIKFDNEDNFLLTGFDVAEFDALLKEFDKDSNSGGSTGDNFDSGKAKEEIDEPISTIGNLYQLGKHFLLCGDSTKPDDVLKLLGNVEPILMVTDPPCGVKYDPKWRDVEGANLGVGERSKGKVKNDDIIDWTDAYKLFPGHIAYVWHAGKYTHIVAKNLEDCGFEIVSQVIWAKQHFAISRGDMHWQHEPCWYVCKKGNNHNWQGARNISTIWNIKNNNSFGNSEKEETYGHGTQKPVDCMLKPILNNTSMGQAIYDPFLGSGTSLVAAEQSGRVCYAMEIDPIYCDVILKRYIDFVENADNLFLIENNKKIKLKEIPKYKKIVGDGNAKK